LPIEISARISDRLARALFGAFCIFFCSISLEFYARSKARLTVRSVLGLNRKLKRSPVPRLSDRYPDEHVPNPTRGDDGRLMSSGPIAAHGELRRNLVNVITIISWLAARQAFVAQHLLRKRSADDDERDTQN
jgi:hypothetical protein